MIDKDKQTMTIYSGRQKMLETISVPEEYLGPAAVHLGCRR